MSNSVALWLSSFLPDEVAKDPQALSRFQREANEALVQAYVDTFPPESKQRTTALTDDVERALDQDIAGLDWMQPSPALTLPFCTFELIGCVMTSSTS